MKYKQLTVIIPKREKNITVTINHRNCIHTASPFYQLSSTPIYGIKYKEIKEKNLFVLKAQTGAEFHQINSVSKLTIKTSQSTIDWLKRQFVIHYYSDLRQQFVQIKLKDVAEYHVRSNNLIGAPLCKAQN